MLVNLELYVTLCSVFPVSSVEYPVKNGLLASVVGRPNLSGIPLCHFYSNDLET